MNTNTLTDEQKQKKQKRFFRDHFDELCDFIKNSDLTHDASPMHALLNAYDFDQYGKEQYLNDNHSEEETKLEFEKRKKNCKWSIIGVEERDVVLGIEIFFRLTSASSVFEESLGIEFSRYRDKLFDVYFELSRLSQEEKSKPIYKVDDGLPEQLEEIFRKETLLAQILKYYGIARSDKAYDIGESQTAFSSFAKKYSEVTKDQSCNNFIPALHLFRTVRNIYAVHRDKAEEEQNKDYATFSKFLSADVPGALRFLIYFYVTLCTLIDKAWSKAKSSEEYNRKKGFPIMSQPDNRNKDAFNLGNRLFSESIINVRVNIKFITLAGHTIKKVLMGNEEVSFQPGNDGSVIINGLTFSRKETPVFKVEFSQPKIKDKTYKADLWKHEIWNGTTIVFIEGEAPTYEYEEDEHVEPTGETEKSSIEDQEKATEGKAAKKADEVLYKLFTEQCDGWELQFKPYFSSERSDEEEHSCCLNGVEIKGVNNCIAIPEYVNRYNPFMQFKVTRVSDIFWKEFEEHGGGFIGIPKGLEYDIDSIPDNVAVFEDKKYWNIGDIFNYTTKNGITFKCAYKKEKECAIIDVDGEKKTVEKIEVPKYACGMLVSEIGEGAFADIETNEVILPDCVETVGKSAFAGSSIWRMRFPKRIKEISAYTFENCKNLQTFESDGQIESLGEYVFAGCKNLELIRLGGESMDIYSLEIHRPDAIIPKGAFMNCCKLKSAYLDVKQIKEKAFMGCTSLTKVDSAYSVKTQEFFIEEIGESAFALCFRLNSIFGADRSNFIALFERNPHRRKLVRVFEPCNNLSSSEKVYYYSHKWSWIIVLLGLVTDVFIFYWVGRFLGWW